MLYLVIIISVQNLPKDGDLFYCAISPSLVFFMLRKICSSYLHPITNVSLKPCSHKGINIILLLLSFLCLSCCHRVTINIARAFHVINVLYTSRFAELHVSVFFLGGEGFAYLFFGFFGVFPRLIWLSFPVMFIILII